MFSWGKKTETAAKKTERTAKNTERTYSCLFCKRKFNKDQIVFGVTLKTPDPAYSDDIFNQQLRVYQHKSFSDDNGEEYGLRPISRRMVDYKSYKGKIIKHEENGLPLVVEGLLEKKEQKTDGLSYGENEDAQNMSDIDDEIILSDERLCPYCHFTLPRGFADEQVYQIGLIGGSRSGKSTYMAVVTEYLREKMGRLNSGLNLAQVELLPECQKYQEALYHSQRKPLGAEADAIANEIKDQMIMPIILHIKPLDESYKPFFIVFQDIPGEYLLPENRKHLINSNIPQSNHIILLVDINHFIKTEQQSEHSDFGAYCKQKVSDIFVNIDALGEVIPADKLKSVQCALTKLDFWIKEDPQLLETEFAHNCDDNHKDAIDVERLGIVHDQIVDSLMNIGGNDQSGLLDNLLASMKKNGTVHCAYTAIASRIVPGHETQIRKNGADYQSSLNVLEPLMNIFDWEHALPVKERE